jgi:flagellar protein FlaI
LHPSLVNGLDAVAVMTHAIVDKTETRRLREIIEVVNVKSDGTAVTNTPFTWNPSDDKFYFRKESKVFDKISNRYGISSETLFKEFQIRTRLLYTLFQRKIVGFDEVQRVINDYFKTPDLVLQRLGISV